MLHVPACKCMDLVAFFLCVCPQAQLCVLCECVWLAWVLLKKTVSEVGCCYYEWHKWWFCSLHTTFLSTHLLPMSLMVMSPHTNSHLTLCCWSYSPFILVCPAWGNPGGVFSLEASSLTFWAFFFSWTLFLSIYLSLPHFSAHINRFGEWFTSGLNIG